MNIRPKNRDALSGNLLVGGNSPDAKSLAVLAALDISALIIASAPLPPCHILGGYFVSRILDGESDGIKKITSALQKYVSLLREMDKVRTTSGGSSNQLQLGLVILSSDYLEPYKSQLSKSHSSLTQNSGLGSCYADRHSDTLNNGIGRDRLFAN